MVDWSPRRRVARAGGRTRSCPQLRSAVLWTERMCAQDPLSDSRKIVPRRSVGRRDLEFGSPPRPRSPREAGCRPRIGMVSPSASRGGGRGHRCRVSSGERSAPERPPGGQAPKSFERCADRLAETAHRTGRCPDRVVRHDGGSSGVKMSASDELGVSQPWASPWCGGPFGPTISLRLADSLVRVGECPTTVWSWNCSSAHR